MDPEHWQRSIAPCSLSKADWVPIEVLEPSGIPHDHLADGHTGALHCRAERLTVAEADDDLAVFCGRGEGLNLCDGMAMAIADIGNISSLARGTANRGGWGYFAYSPRPILIFQQPADRAPHFGAK